MENVDVSRWELSEYGEIMDGSRMVCSFFRKEEAEKAYRLIDFMRNLAKGTCWLPSELDCFQHRAANASHPFCPVCAAKELVG